MPLAGKPRASFEVSRIGSSAQVFAGSQPRRPARAGGPAATRRQKIPQNPAPAIETNHVNRCSKQMRASRRGIQLSLPTGTQTMMPSKTNQMSALNNTHTILKRLAHQQLTHQPGPQSRREKTANVSQTKLPGGPISKTPLCIKLHILHNAFRRKTALKGKCNNDLRTAKWPWHFLPALHAYRQSCPTPAPRPRVSA